MIKIVLSFMSSVYLAGCSILMPPMTDYEIPFRAETEGSASEINFEVPYQMNVGFYLKYHDVSRLAHEGRYGVILGRVLNQDPQQSDNNGIEIPVRLNITDRTGLIIVNDLVSSQDTVRGSVDGIERSLATLIMKRGTYRARLLSVQNEPALNNTIIGFTIHRSRVK